MKQAQFLEVDQSGIILDLPPEEVPGNVFTSCGNISFRDNAAYRVEGYAQYGPDLADTTVPIYSYPASYQGINYWIVFTADSISVTDGYTYDDITPVGGLNATTAGEWTAVTLNGIPVFSNPQNPPMYWALDTANPALVLPGWPVGATCNAISAVKYHLVALGITEDGISYPSQVWWSEGVQAGAIPQEWLPTPENDAGDTILADSTGSIMGAYPLRDQLVIYKDNSTYIMQYVAGQYVYAFRKIFPYTGMASRHAVCEVGSEHWVFTGTDVVRHDGQNFTSVAFNKVQRHLVNSIDPEQIQLVTLVARLTDNQVWVCIPTTTAQWLTSAVIFDVNNETIGLRDLPAVASLKRGTVSPTDTIGTWDELPYTWEEWPDQWNGALFLPNADGLIMTKPESADPRGKLLNLGASNSADGEAIPAFVERLSAMIEPFHKNKLLTAFVPRITAPDGTVLTVRFGSQAIFEDDIAWGEEQTMVIGTNKAIGYFISGRYLSIRISADTIAPWKLYSYVLKYAVQGTF